MEITRNPDTRTRDTSPAVGLTGRTVRAIVAGPDAAGYLTRIRNGRRTGYTVNRTVRPERMVRRRAGNNSPIESLSPASMTERRW